jgi:hypothetical protein
MFQGTFFSPLGRARGRDEKVRPLKHPAKGPH